MSEVYGRTGGPATTASSSSASTTPARPLSIDLAAATCREHPLGAATVAVPASTNGLGSASATTNGATTKHHSVLNMPSIETTDTTGATRAFLHGDDDIFFGVENEEGEESAGAKKVKNGDPGLEEEDEEEDEDDLSYLKDPAREGLSRPGNTIIGTNVRWPCGMTNFHVSLCVGVMGFCVFWLILLLRIYLPESLGIER